jgi:hypothetical protein
MACYCVSGWNITIIATVLYAVAGGLKLSKRAAFWAILACIWLYTLFVGVTPHGDPCGGDGHHMIRVVYFIVRNAHHDVSVVM